MILMRPILIVLALAALVACGTAVVNAAREEPVPAALEAQRLRATEPPAAAEVRDLRTQELAAARTAAAAMASGDTARAEVHHRLAEELARLRATAEVREREQREQLEALALAADGRALEQRAELDRRAAQTQAAAEARAAEARRQSDRRWAGWGIALAVAAGIALGVLGLPALISGGVPAAVAAGCLTLAAWSSVPWLATVLGIVLAMTLLLGLALIGRHVLREWLRYAEILGADPDRRVAADAESVARQPRALRWILDRMLVGQRV